MPTPITLPKVANYIKNVGKSVSLASIDYLKEIAPNTSEFLETNEDLLKEIGSSVINYRETVKKANASFKKSKVYEAYEVGKKALFEDLKTGKWYNAEREEAMGMKAMDLEMDDMEFDDSMFSFEDTDTSDAARQSRAFDASISASTKVQANVTARSADLVSSSIKASTSALFAQNERMMATMTSGMGTLHAAVSGVNEYLQGPMMTALQNTKIFQEQSMEHYKKVEAQMDELLEMQRNLYSATNEEMKSSDYGNVVDYGGIPDLREYGKVIKKNFKDLIGPEAEMLFGNTFGKDSNMLLTLVSSPLKAIPELLVKTIVPITVKQATEQFDKSISGVFSTLISKLGGMRDSENPILSTLGRLFGIKVDMKSSVATDKYKKGPVPFDGITRQTIIEVIPGHLRRIEAALTGQAERIYDVSRGKWGNIRTVEKDFRDRQQSAMTMAFSDITRELNSYIEELKKTNESQANEYLQALEDIKLKVFEDRGNFLGYNSKNGDKPWEYYGVDRDVYMKMMRFFLDYDPDDLKKQKPKYDRLMGLSREVNNQIESWNQFMESAAQGNNPVLQLFNGAYDIDTTFGLKYDPNKSRNGIRYTNILVDAVDENNKNIFFYLRGIYNMMGGKSSGGTSTTTPPASGGTGGSGRIYVPGYIQRRSGIAESTSQQDRVAYEDTTENFILNEAMKEKYGDGTQQTIFVGEAKKRFRDASLGEKWKIAQENINLILKKPTDALENIINSADKRLFELMFGKEEAVDAEKKFGKKPGGLLEYMLIRMEETFNKMDDWLHENVFDKIKTWLDNEFGFSDKVKRVKDWVKDKIRWEDIRKNIRGKWDSAKGQVTGAFRSVGSDIYGATDSAFIQSIGKILNPRIGIHEDFLANEQLQQALSNMANRQNNEFVGGTNRKSIGGNAGNISPQQWEKFRKLIAQYRKNGLTYAQAETRARQAMGFAAGGRFVTQRGLVVVSPGETIIPATFDKSGQAIQLAKEKAYARRFGLDNVGFKATGTVDSPTGAAETISEEAAAKEKEKVTDTIKKVAKEVNMSGDYADLAVNSLLGAGVSLVTGMIGGPLLGAALGAGVSILKQSETAKTIFFGKMGEDGEREGGLISANLQKNFKKYFPDMKNHGIVGAVAGLITPLGLVGGLMTGGAIGFLKNNDKFQEFMFGKIGEDGERDGGIINKELRKKLTKAAPRMLVGAAGGALLGPFGLLGNVVMGSAIGYATTTQKFHDIIFGYEDDNGKHKDGLLDALKKGMIDPLLEFGKNLRDEFKEFFKNRIMKPLGKFVSPFAQMIKNAITSVADRIHDSFQEKVVTPIGDYIHHRVLEPLGNVLGKVIRAPINLAKGVISAPFAALGFIGDNMRSTQIAKGTATNMTAAERVQWRRQHGGRRTFNNLIGRDKFGAADKMLATQFEGDKGLEELKAMRDNMKIYLETRKEMGARVAQLEQDLFNEISDILNSSTMQVDGSTVSVYSYVGYKYVKHIKDLINRGELDEIAKELNSGKWRDVPGDIKAEIIAKVNQLGTPIRQAIDRKKNAAEYNARFEGYMKKHTGLNNRTSIRRFMRNVDKEIETRENLTEEEKDRKNREEVANAQTERMQEFLAKQKDDIIASLDAIAKAIYVVGGKANVYQQMKEAEEIKAAEEAAAAAEEDASDLEYDFMTSIDKTLPETRKSKKIAKGGGVFSKFKNIRQQGKDNTRRMRQTVGKGIGDLFSSIKNQAASGFAAGREEAAAWYEKKQAEKAEERAKRREEMAAVTMALTGGAAGVAGKSGLVGEAAEKATQTLQANGGILTGNKSDVIEAANKGYYTVVEHGRVGVVDGSGELLDTDSAAEIEEQRKEDSEFKEKQAEATEKMSHGIVSVATGILGKGWELGKRAVGGLIDAINNIIDSNPVTKLVKNLVLGVFTVAGIGKFAEFWSETLYPIIEPIWIKITEGLSGLGSTLLGWMEGVFPGISDTVSSIFNTVKGFFTNPGEALAGVASWVFDGLKKFWDYIVVDLYDMLLNAFKGVSLADFNAERERRNSEYQAVDENGNLLYLDEEGNTTTENTGTAKMTTTSVTTTTYKDNLWNDLTNKGRKERREAKNAAGYTFVYEEYYSGCVAIQNTDTGAWISLQDGIGSKTLNVGWRVNENGEPMVLDKGASS